MKRIIIFCLIVIFLICSLPATFYCYWILKGVFDPSATIDARGVYIKLPSEKLVRKMDSIDPFNPYPNVAMEILAQREDIKAVPKLIQLLNSGNSYRRRGAIRALGKISDERAINPLEQMLKKTDPNSEEHKLILRSLERINGK